MTQQEILNLSADEYQLLLNQEENGFIAQLEAQHDLDDLLDNLPQMLRKQAI